LGYNSTAVFGSVVPNKPGEFLVLDRFDEYRGSGRSNLSEETSPDSAPENMMEWSRVVDVHRNRTTESLESPVNISNIPGDPNVRTQVAHVVDVIYPLEGVQLHSALGKPAPRIIAQDRLRVVFPVADIKLGGFDEFQLVVEAIKITDFLQVFFADEVGSFIFGW
jgi:hypothetical protein